MSNEYWTTRSDAGSGTFWYTVEDNFIRQINEMRTSSIPSHWFTDPSERIENPEDQRQSDLERMIDKFRIVIDPPTFHNNDLDNFINFISRPTLDEILTFIDGPFYNKEYIRELEKLDMTEEVHKIIKAKLNDDN